jgi:hypothetical protein
VFRLEGGGEDGEGEDVIYDGLDHISLRDRGALLDIVGEYTLGSCGALLDGLDLFPDPPVREDSRDYRRWAIESAALDLALRQAGAPWATCSAASPSRCTTWSPCAWARSGRMSPRAPIGAPG